jgi:hypothetical protein
MHQRAEDHITQLTMRQIAQYNLTVKSRTPSPPLNHTQHYKFNSILQASSIASFRLVLDKANKLAFTSLTVLACPSVHHVFRTARLLIYFIVATRNNDLRTSTASRFISSVGMPSSIGGGRFECKPNTGRKSAGCNKVTLFQIGGFDFLADAGAWTHIICSADSVGVAIYYLNCRIAMNSLSGQILYIERHNSCTNTISGCFGRRRITQIDTAVATNIAGILDTHPLPAVRVKGEDGHVIMPDDLSVTVIDAL